MKIPAVQSSLFAFILLAAVAGCEGPEGSEGSSGEPGPTGSSGPQGSPGPAAPRLVWKDATGALSPWTVLEIRRESSGVILLEIMDTAGYLWRADPRTGIAASGQLFIRNYLYTSSDCSGTPFVESSFLTIMTPRDPLPFGDVPDHLVLRDDPAALPSPTSLSVGSMRGSTGCGTASTTINAIAASALTTVTLPAAVAAPPLHPELLP